MVKSVLAAILLVSVPEAFLHAGMQDRVNFGQLFHKIFDAMIVTVLPAVVGLFALSREIILFISGESYLDAGMPLRILSVALIASLFGWLYNTCVLVPWKRESDLESNAYKCGAERRPEPCPDPVLPRRAAAALYDAAGRAVFHGDASTTRKGWWSSCSIGRSSGRWRWDAWHSGGLHGGQGAAAAAPHNDFYGGTGVGGGLRRDPDRAEKTRWCWSIWPNSSRRSNAGSELFR